MTDRQIPFVRPDVRQFLDMLIKSPRPTLGSVPIQQHREVLRAVQPMLEAPGRPVAHIEDMVVDGPAGPIPIRYYDDRDEWSDAPVILFVHGGGFVLFDIDHYDSVAREFARQTKLPVVSVEYRLAPEHPFPAAPDDVEAAARAVVAPESPLPFHPTSLILAGDSGGGNLAIVTALALAEKPANAPVSAIAALYPAVSDNDRSPSMLRFSEGYMLDRASMLYFVESYAAPRGDPRSHLMDRDLSVLPPTLVMTATLDPLHDQGVEFVASLHEAGVPVRHYEAEGNIHGLIMYRKICPSSQGDLDSYLAMLNDMIEETTGTATE